MLRWTSGCIIFSAAQVLALSCDLFYDISKFSMSRRLEQWSHFPALYFLLLFACENSSCKEVQERFWRMKWLHRKQLIIVTKTVSTRMWNNPVGHLTSTCRGRDLWANIEQVVVNLFNTKTPSRSMNSILVISSHYPLVRGYYHIRSQIGWLRQAFIFPYFGSKSQKSRLLKLFFSEALLLDLQMIILFLHLTLIFSFHICVPISS